MAPRYNYDISVAQEASTRQYLYRQFFITPPIITLQNADLSGKTAIVTGSNIGLGFECAKQLLDLRLSHLILAVRSPSKGGTAKQELLLATGKKEADVVIEVWELDLSSYDSIIAFADKTKSLNNLDIVILNAGVYKVEETFNPHTGIEEDIQVNFLSTALLTTLLLPVMQSKRRRSSDNNNNLPGRITIVSSDTAGWAQYNERTSSPLLSAFKKGQNKTGVAFNMQERYSTSKLLTQLFISELTSRVNPESVIVNLSNPGFCYGSDLQREGNGTILGFIVRVITRVMGRPIAEGARSLTAAAVCFGPEVHGEYVEDCQIRPSAPLLYTTEGKALAKRLWEETMEELSFAQAREKVAAVQ